MYAVMFNGPMAELMHCKPTKIRQSGNIKYNGEPISYQIDNYELTTVKLSDGSKGVSKLDKEDTYNEAVGIFVAYWKAKKAQLNKIKEMEPEINKHLEDIKKI